MLFFLERTVLSKNRICSFFLYCLPYNLEYNRVSYFCLLCCKPTEPLICDIFIATSTGDCMAISYIYKGCGIVLNERKFIVDILPLEINHFDVILAMDWLVLNVPGQTEFHFLREHNCNGKIFICTIRDNKMLAKGCEGFFACVILDKK